MSSVLLVSFRHFILGSVSITLDLAFASSPRGHMQKVTTLLGNKVVSTPPECQRDPAWRPGGAWRRH